ncbi:YihY/virulence factor BrkB family protein [Pedobacter aquae]|uniref:YihY/virulence factor BrkB family protein n=2 Tax=Pedobacter aquae TaxID=2605747 RepID=A0A5C0VMD7_9SPHI|nr:YihY/virulence factor BrkB family protein [Pedobacter aquae]
MKKIIAKAKFIFKIIIKSFNAFMADKGLKLSASLSYYTIFSLGPMLVVLLSVAGFFYQEKQVLQEKVFEEIQGFIGSQAALQVQSLLKNLALSGDSVVAIIIGVITLLIGATGIFIEIQDSINQIWKVKAVPKKGWLKLLKDRFLSLSMVGSLGFLLIVSLIINGMVSAVSTVLSNYLPENILFLFDVVNLMITFLVLVFLFSIIYKVLPDAEIPWRGVRTGAIFTSLLFMLGEYLIRLYIGYTAVGSVYGAAGTLVVIAVWVYYSAAILFFGAEFTKVYAEEKGERIKPSSHAVYIKMIEEEQHVKYIPKEEEN